jgi:nucleoside-diphosphate-sugar epimerase
VKVFLTGAGGFIGSHVAQALARRGHEISDKADLGIHLAWYVEPGQYLESPLNDQCRDDSLKMVKSMSCRRWVVAGSCFEEMPNTRYARSKRELYLALDRLSIELAWVRLFHLYGPREHPQRFVPVVINALLDGRPAPLTDGNEVRDFLHVEDVAEAIVTVAMSQLTGIVNIGSGVPVTIREVATQIAGIVDRPDLLQFGAYRPPVKELPVLVADTTRLNSIWRPRVDLPTGLRETIEWWRQARSQTSAH